MPAPPALSTVTLSFPIRITFAGFTRYFDKEISLVFVTGYEDYVFDGYKVNALDYVIKPAGTERLMEVLDRAACAFHGNALVPNPHHLRRIHQIPLMHPHKVLWTM